jgi:hypothetical protein
MKPFTDPFPFRVPETRTSIGEVIAKITNTEVVEEGKAGELIEAYRMTPARAEILKKEKKKAQKTIDDGMEKEYESGMTDSEHGAAGKAFNRKHRIDLIKMKTKPVREGVVQEAGEKPFKSVMAAHRERLIARNRTPEYRKKHDNRLGGKAPVQTTHTPTQRGEAKRYAIQIGEQAVNESHTRAQLEKMTTTQLRVLLKKYTALVAGGAMTAAAELANIRGLLRAKGAGVVLDEAVMGKKKWKSVVSNWKKPQDSTSARLDAGAEKRGGAAAQDKAADAVKVRLGGKTKP